jgi:hypothetical protein
MPARHNANSPANPRFFTATSSIIGKSLLYKKKSSRSTIIDNPDEECIALSIRTKGRAKALEKNKEFKTKEKGGGRDRVISAKVLPKGMREYKIAFGSGTHQPYVEKIRVEDYENEQDAIDKLIDKMEEEGNKGMFLTQEQLAENGGEFHEDEYIIGGNHGRILYHGGILSVEELVDSAQ